MMEVRRALEDFEGVGERVITDPDKSLCFAPSGVVKGANEQDNGSICL